MNVYKFCVRKGNNLKKKYYFVQTNLNGRESRHYRGRTEPVRDEREVRQMPLDGRVQDVLRSGIAQRGPVLVEQVHQFFRNLEEIDSSKLETFIYFEIISMDSTCLVLSSSSFLR